MAGIRDSFSAGLGIFPLGIALGLLVIQAGLPWWLAPALSLSVFAGSLELMLVGMIAAAVPLAAVALTTLGRQLPARLLRVLVSTSRGAQPVRQGVLWSTQ